VWTSASALLRASPTVANFRFKREVWYPRLDSNQRPIGLEGSVASFCVRRSRLNLGKDAVRATLRRVRWSCLRGI